MKTCTMNEESLWVIIGAAVAALSSLWAAVLPDPIWAQVLMGSGGTGGSLFDDERLRLVCLSGSIGGAIVSVGLFRPRNTQELAWKLTCSGLSGMMFSPMIMRYIGWPLEADHVLAASGSVALLSWGVLQMAVPLMTRFGEFWIKSKWTPEPEKERKDQGNGQSDR